MLYVDDAIVPDTDNVTVYGVLRCPRLRPNSFKSQPIVTEGVNLITSFRLVYFLISTSFFWYHT